jgi:hypothetical protein
LPLTDRQGLVESNITRQIKHELMGFDINNPEITQSQRILGYQIFWTFNYGEWVRGETLTAMQEILYYAKQGASIKLVPRTDQPLRDFNVIFTGESFDVGIGKGGVNAWRNRLPVFRFETKNLEPDLKWTVTPEPGTVFGVNWNLQTWVQSQNT